VQPTPAQRLIGDFAPKLVELTDNVLSGDVWARPELSQRDRSLVTVSALIALNRPDQLRSHLTRARENGVTQEELIEAITHLAFYAGWPNAITAISVAKEVFQTKRRAGRRTGGSSKVGRWITGPVAHARRIIEASRQDYNLVRRHVVLGCLAA
jgi:alkylhydroperoxidase/carboxymuconolactone decarboxylase family protein YurZ